MPDRSYIARIRRRKARRQTAVRITFHALAWIGAAVLYYIGFSLLFDTPVEYNLRHSTDRMREEYEALSARLDTLNMVLDNIAERDRGIYRLLFESEPTSFDADYEHNRLALHERLITRSKRELMREFDARVNAAAEHVAQAERITWRLFDKLESMGSAAQNIPAIQPVINTRLTLLTAGYGMLIHPFYRTLQAHQGVDYTIPEGSSVFATADGTVKEVSSRNSTSGLTVTIDHGNGYITSYSHLKEARVRRGSRVRRGDIIALSGDSGLSLAPHLHYEVRYNDMRVDPIHYFFMELTPDSYQRMISIAQSGMQSFD